jgi:hypothetical protein
MRAIITRLTRLEQSSTEQQEKQAAEVENAGIRLKRGALSGLTTTELEHLRVYIVVLEANRGAQPNAPQRAALEAYKRYYQEFQTAGLHES